MASIVGLACVSGCAEDDGGGDDNIATFVDLTADFDAYGTWAFAPVDPPTTPPPWYTPTNRNAFRNAVEREMGELGLSMDTTDPDLYVTGLVRTEEIDATLYEAWWEYYLGYYGGYWYMWVDQTPVQFETGTLIMDVIDRREITDSPDGRLVFRGAAIGVMPTDPTDLSVPIDKGVKKFFKDWPIEE